MFDGLQIRDAGFQKKKVDRIFEFYYTTKDEGTGLGLSIAQRIIYQHGGHIDVESRPEWGTTFPGVFAQ